MARQYLSRVLRFACAAALALGLSACAGGAAAPLVMASTDIYGYSANRKSNVDSLISAVAGQNCSFRNLGVGRSYCLEETSTATEPTAYCYRTIADVTCYREARPADASRLLH
jgi:hypothetical protein